MRRKEKKEKTILLLVIFIECVYEEKVNFRTSVARDERRSSFSADFKGYW